MAKESNQLINELYSHCELILYPSLYEGFGLPVVATNSNGGKIYWCMIQRLNRELKMNLIKKIMFIF